MFKLIIIMISFLSTSAFMLSRSTSITSSAMQVQMGLKLVVPEDEPIENTLRRFKKAVAQKGHLVELRFKEHWENAHDKRKRKAERAMVLNKIERTNDQYERRAEGGNEYNS